LSTTAEPPVSRAEVIICFESTTQAILAEQTLLEKALNVRVMPKPSAIQAGCGFCLRFLPEDIEKVVPCLADCGIVVTAIYRMEESGGKASYSVFQQ
jgi:hypothetical protein